MNGRPGRPKKSNLERLRTMAWCRSVMYQSKNSLYALEQEFSPPGLDDGHLPTSLWKKYAKGDATPGRTRRTAGLLERVDRVYPGTARVFRHPIWRALDEEYLDHVELGQLFAQLPDEYRGRIMADFTGVRFWRVHEDEAIKYGREASLPTIDYFGFLACCLRDAERRQSGHKHKFFLGHLISELRKLPASDSVLGQVAPSIIVEIAKVWNGIVYPKARGRAEEVTIDLVTAAVKSIEFR